MIWLFDSGHGGMIDNQYTTAPDKMYKFDNGEVAYEGVINRKLVKYIKQFNDIQGLKYIDIVGSNLDISLDIRVDHANNLQQYYNNCVYCSFHSNAGKGTGIEVFTYINESKSDHYATQLIKTLKNSLPELVFRTDYSDGDPDKESLFYVLKYTKMPAFLLETLFFDNYLDYQLLKDDYFLKKVAKAFTTFQKLMEIQK